MMACHLNSAEVFLPSLTQLRAFYEVARLTSITGAAETLLRSQSAVTQSIQKLEIELGVTLLDRTSTGSFLTHMGQILNDRIEQCFARIHAAVGELVEPGANDPVQVEFLARRITRAQILALTAVHTYGSLALAARHVQVSLTSLHRSARTLEKQLGCELLANSAQGVTTNRAGERFSNQLLLAVRELEWAAEEIRARRGALQGRIAVGTLLLAGNPFVAVRLEQFMADYPDVRVQLVHGSYEELLAKLRGGTIDLLIGLLKGPPPADDVVEESLGPEPYLIATRRGHPLASRSVTADDLCAADWILPRPTSARYSAFMSIFKNHPLPTAGIETHSLLTLLLLLGHSDRVALLTESELAIDRRFGNQFTALDYPVRAAPAEMGVTTRADWTPSRLQNGFLNSLRSVAFEP